MKRNVKDFLIMCDVVASVAPPGQLGRNVTASNPAVAKVVIAVDIPDGTVHLPFEEKVRRTDPLFYFILLLTSLQPITKDSGDRVWRIIAPR